MRSIVLRLADLPRDIYVRLDDNTRSELLRRATRVLGRARLSKELGITLRMLRNAESGVALLKLGMWLKMAEIAHYPLEKLEAGVIAIRGRKGPDARIELPLNATPEFVEMTGYVVSSGVKVKKYIVLLCDSPSLVERIADLAFNLWRVKLWSSEKRVILPLSVSVIFEAAGVPTSTELGWGWEIPPWVKMYPKDFLRGFQSGCRLKIIASRGSLRFYIKAHNHKRASSFLESIASLYRELGVNIMSSPRIISVKDNYYCVLDIYRRDTIEEMLKLGFTSNEKTEMVKELLLEKILATRFPRSPSFNR